MRTTITNRIGSILFLAMFLLSVGQTNAQEAAQKVYVDVGCIKVKNPGNPENDAFLMNDAMAYNKVAMQKGMIMDFLLFRMMYPNGDDCKCDYRMVTVHGDMAQLDMFAAPDSGMKIAGEAFGDQAMAKWEKWLSLYNFKGSELFELTMSASDGPVYSPMTHVNFMSVMPENGMAYETMEKDVWMPVVKEAMKEGMLMDMTIWKRVMPNGKGYEGDYIQVVDIENFAQMGGWEMEKFAAIFKKVHPEADMMEMMEKSGKLSKVVRDETMMMMGRLSASNESN